MYCSTLFVLISIVVSSEAIFSSFLSWVPIRGRFEVNRKVFFLGEPFDVVYRKHDVYVPSPDSSKPYVEEKYPAQEKPDYGEKAVYPEKPSQPHYGSVNIEEPELKEGAPYQEAPPSFRSLGAKNDNINKYESDSVTKFLHNAKNYVKHEEDKDVIPPPMYNEYNEIRDNDSMESRKSDIVYDNVSNSSLITTVSTNSSARENVIALPSQNHFSVNSSAVDDNSTLVIQLLP